MTNWTLLRVLNVPQCQISSQNVGKYLKKSFITFMCVHVCMCTCLSRHTCCSQRTACSSWFSHCTSVLGIKPRPSGLSASAFTLCAILLTQDLILSMKIDRHTHFVSEPTTLICGEIKWTLKMHFFKMYYQQMFGYLFYVLIYLGSHDSFLGIKGQCCRSLALGEASS